MAQHTPITAVFGWLSVHPGEPFTIKDLVRDLPYGRDALGRALAHFERRGMVQSLSKQDWEVTYRPASQPEPEPERQPEPELQGELIMPPGYDDGYDDEFPESEFDYYINGNGPADDEFITRPVLTVEISRYFKGKDGLRRFVGKDMERNRRLMLRYDTPGGRS